MTGNDTKKPDALASLQPNRYETDDYKRGFYDAREHGLDALEAERRERAERDAKIREAARAIAEGDYEMVESDRGAAQAILRLLNGGRADA